MIDGLKQSRKLLGWYKEAFRIAGVWPLGRSDLRFILWGLYTAFQYSLIITLMIEISDAMEIVVTIADLTWVGMVIPKLIVIRFSRKLPKLVHQIVELMEENSFENDTENEIYLSYSQQANTFVMITGPLMVCGLLMHYTKPLVLLLLAVRSYNGSDVIVYVPYETYVFFEANDYYTLSAWWIWELPMLLVNSFHPTALGFTLFLIYHACGELSVLSYRISNLGESIGANPAGAAGIFRKIVAKHNTILRMTKDINDVFSFLFLEELFLTTLMIILSFHTVITTADFSDTGALLAFAVYAVIMFALLYAYCIAGERLMLESANVNEAYYKCLWYDLPDTCKKQLIICMNGSSRPIQLVGGGFFVFSLSAFTGILKTSMSYVSLLRTLVAE